MIVKEAIVGVEFASEHAKIVGARVKVCYVLRIKEVHLPPMGARVVAMRHEFPQCA